MEQVAPHVPQLGDAEEVDAVVVTDARPLPAQRTDRAGRPHAGGRRRRILRGRGGDRRRRRAPPGAPGAAPRPAAAAGDPQLDVAATRSFLVDVHLLNRKP